MTHALIAVVMCGVFMLLKSPSWLCLLPAVFYIGREFTQAEYRYIEAFCSGLRTNMPWYAPFLPSAWTVKGMMDWVLPLVVCLAAMWIMKFFGTNAA